MQVGEERRYSPGHIDRVQVVPVLLIERCLRTWLLLHTAKIMPFLLRP